MHINLKVITILLTRRYLYVLSPSSILCFPVMNYEVVVVTGDVMFAGTNAKVFIQIYGDKGKTEVIRLESRSNNFERNTTEIFKV